MVDKREFKIPVRVYYEDTDFSGIVYHANYLKFFERGRTEALRQCGITHTDLLARQAPLVFAVRKMITDWIIPARIDDELVVVTEFRHIRGARMWLDQVIYRPAVVHEAVAHEVVAYEKGHEIARAEVEAVCLSQSGRARRVPDDLLKMLQ